MPVSRRKFLKNSAVAAAAFVAAPLPAVWSEVREPSSNSASHLFGKTQVLDRHVFEQAIGSPFKVLSASGSSQPVWLTLLSVKDLPALVPVNPASMAVPPPRASMSFTTTGFMLAFNTSSPPMPQGVYILQHPVLGTFHLLIVPDGRGANTYTAVFNMLNPVAAAHFRPPQRFRPDSVGGNGGGVTKPAASGGALSLSPSSVGRPAEQPVEPVFRNGLEPKLPE
jgi:hypothetical protein